MSGENTSYFIAARGSLRILNEWIDSGRDLPPGFSLRRFKSGKIVGLIYSPSDCVSLTHDEYLAMVKAEEDAAKAVSQ